MAEYPLAAQNLHLHQVGALLSKTTTLTLCKTKYGHFNPR